MRSPEEVVALVSLYGFEDAKLILNTDELIMYERYIHATER